MLQWGRFFQNGSTGCKPCLLNLSVLSIWREASCRISRVSSTLHSWDWKVGFPHSSLGTRHFGQQFSLQQAMRHCSGWLARYAERIGKVSWILPSEQSILTPSILALCHRTQFSLLFFVHFQPNFTHFLYNPFSLCLFFLCFSSYVFLHSQTDNKNTFD